MHFYRICSITSHIKRLHTRNKKKLPLYLLDINIHRFGFIAIKVIHFDTSCLFSLLGQFDDNLIKSCAVTWWALLSCSFWYFLVNALVNNHMITSLVLFLIYYWNKKYSIMPTGGPSLRGTWTLIAGLFKACVFSCFIMIQSEKQEK